MPVPDPVPPLAALGRRIMVCGPSNAGKSTLAVAIGRKLGLPVVHLDQLSHLPDTDWQPRPEAEFAALHDEAVRADEWVIDGNYSRLFPTRVPRATGIILLADHRLANFVRYLRRTLFQTDRAGALRGGRDSLKWEMVHWILYASPRSQRRLQQHLPTVGLPLVRTGSMHDVQALYRAWDLLRP